jgi:predicted amidophosphoribosyltransferase
LTVFRHGPILTTLIACSAAQWREAARMRCVRCQQENVEGARFCGECGARLDAGCAACGAVNPPANNFCHECGAPLGGAARAGRFASPETYTPGHLAKKILVAQSELVARKRNSARG